MNKSNLLPALLSVLLAGSAQLLAQAPSIAQQLNALLPPIDPAKIPKDTLREIKTAGETYYAEGQLDIIGDVASDKLKGWFKKEAKNIHFTSRWAMIERISSVDTNSGRVVSEIEIIEINSQIIGGAHTRFEVASVNSQGTAKFIAEHYDEIISKGDMLLTALDSSPWGVASKFARWLGAKKIAELKSKGYRVESDGAIVVPTEEVMKWRPELEGVVGVAGLSPKVNGAKFQATWEWGKGYTMVLTNPREEFDKEAITAFKKAFERSSLLSAQLIFPAREHGRSLKLGDSWQVNAGALAGTLMTGFSFDRIEGILLLKYLEEKVGNFPDEKRNLGNRTNGVGLVVLGVDEYAASPNNIVSGVFDNPRNEAERVSFRIKPAGRLTLVSDPDIPSRYVREVKLTADNLAETKQFEDSLLKGVKFTGKAKVTVQFDQHRVRVK